MKELVLMVLMVLIKKRHRPTGVENVQSDAKHLKMNLLNSENFSAIIIIIIMVFLDYHWQT